MSGTPDPDDVGPLLDPTGGPNEPTPEFTPTPEAEDLANWIAGIDDERPKEREGPEVATGPRLYARPTPDVLDTPRALHEWCDQFIDAIFGSVEWSVTAED